MPRQNRDQGFFHSVHLKEDKCKGCVNCIRRCPTEAIRVRDGRANIIETRCIDCGECVRTCANKAKVVIADSLAALENYKFRIAIPAPALYGQFPEGTSGKRVLAALLTIGFDYAVDVALGADMAALKIREYLEKSPIERPMISSACPAVVRLIQVRFPDLITQIMPVISPMRAAALIARGYAHRATNYTDDEVGVFFITPCPGKVSAINDPEGYEERVVNGAIAISEVYPLIRDRLSRDIEQLDKLGERLHPGSGSGVGWARSGGEVLAIGEENQIAVDGIHNVIQILEEAERGKLNEIDYIEAQACVGGCVGGVLTVENPFITRRRVRIMASKKTAQIQSPLPEETLENEYWFKHDRPIEPRPTLKLDDDMAEAIRKMYRMEQILQSLPGLDCGSCGAPNCQALAEDVVRGLATEMDCVFKLRERVAELAGEMMELAKKAPPAMGHGEKRTNESDNEATSRPTESEAGK